MVTATPSRVRLRAYQVGFGDCLLLTVTYPKPLPDGRTEGHLLIDFGAKVLAKKGPRMVDVAAKIAEHCGNHLDVVVATHRHQDHVRGFGDKDAMEHLDPLQPDVIIRPWTDMTAKARRDSAHDLDGESKKFHRLLDILEDHNALLAEQFDLDERVLAERTNALAKLGVSNVAALAMLDAWVPADRTRWVRTGDTVDVESRLPGVHIEVLGPPTLKQVPNLKSYAGTSKEYWLGMIRDKKIEPELLAAKSDQELQAKDVVAEPEGLGRASWLLDKLHDSGLRQVLEIAEGFNDVLNNTSVVLLVKVGRRSLLLAGDAQVENWSYVLDLALGENGREEDQDLRTRLAAVDLYKVGHHGSRNATPRRLVDLWSRERHRDHVLCSVLSTRTGVYGTTTEGKVPKKELLDALESLGDVHTTEALENKVWWFDVEASTTTEGASFEYRAGPTQA